MRVHFPGTFDTLSVLAQEGSFPISGGWGFAVTQALRDSFTSGEEEEIAEYAFDDAALASLRVLLQGSQRFPHRRVVVSADIPDAAVEGAEHMGDSVVAVAMESVPMKLIAAIHVDIAESEPATAKAMEAIVAADAGDEGAELTVGDAMDNYLAWYAPDELALLTTDLDAN